MAISPSPVSGGAQSGLMARAQGVPAAMSRFAAQPALRRALPSLVILAAAGLALLAWLVWRDAPRSALYPGLPEAEKARVVEALSAAGVDARVDQTTGEVTVPTAEYHRARLSLASQGLPQAVPDGQQALSDIPLGASRSLENARLRQSQEMDLARSIAEIGSVQAARVHLAWPERSAFLRDNHPPRASVFVTMLQGRVLDAGQVEAIVHLVSSSVPGLARADVSVVDQTGRLLSRVDDGDGAQMAERHLRHRVELETLLRRRIEALLIPVVGFGNLSVEVTAEMDFTRRDIREERVDPEGNALRSEQLSESLTRDPAAGGIPGAVTNTPPQEADLAEAPTTQTAQADPRNQSSSTTRNFEVSRTVSSTQPETGQVERLSAAIVIRAPDLADPAADAAQAQAELVQSLQPLVESAIAYNAARGDSVTILVRPFAMPATTEAAPTGAALPYAQHLPDILRALVVIVVVAVVGLGILRPLLQRRLNAIENGVPGAEYGPGMIEVAEGDTLEDVEEKLNQRHRDLAQSVLGRNASRADKQAVLQKLAKDDPAHVASVIHRMIQPELETTG